MAREFKLPDLGEGIHEGEIVKVLVSPGDEVKEDQPILEVETDKATVEITSPFAGKVTTIRVKQGDLVQVGDVMIVFDGAGAEEAAGPVAEPVPGPAAPPGAKEAKPPEKPREPIQVAPPERREGPVPASPSTRRLARELGVDLRQVPPSGPGGRVTTGDVQAFAAQAKEVAPTPLPEKTAPRAEVSPVRPSSLAVPPLPDFERWGEVERVQLRSVRRSTAKHMALAWSQIPHVSHHDVADITALEALRQRSKERVAERGGSLSLTVFVMKAAVAALKEYPRFNASLDADTEEIILKRYYHLGIATDTERGLLVPVVRDVDRKSVTQLSFELVDLLERTRSGDATLEEMQGGTFTITNPGPLGGTSFSPIVNYPEVAILGMARAKWQPVVRGDGEAREIVSRYLLPLVLTFDHRVVDGADAARFVGMVVRILEDPDTLLLMI
jgi:pyruvate dehydrogenase E2 component (dihydrolipoamide acetyltransferase)